jgi:WD40 repeat protein
MLMGHQNSVNALAFSPDGQLLASGSGSQFGNMRDDSARLWDTATGALQQTFRDHKGPVIRWPSRLTACSWRPPHTCTIQLLDAATGGCSRLLRGENSGGVGSLFNQTVDY